MTIKNVGFAALSATSPLVTHYYDVRDLKDHDVLVEVEYCGICHSDIHAVRSEWFPVPYPLVPGHEFTGRVVRVGSCTTKHKVGDRVAVGCLVNSCRTCGECKEGFEQFCDKQLQTYGMVGEDGQVTQGGYGKYVVAHEHFTLRLPENLPMDRAAPLLCAGITTYSPLVHCGAKKGNMRVGIIGFGGLGHMAVQFAAKFGNEVVVISRTPAKRELAKELGATKMICTDEEFAEEAEKLDLLLDTVSANKPMTKYLDLLRQDGTMIVVGAPPTSEQPKIDAFSLLHKRRRIMGSPIGGIEQTQEMLDFCAENQVLPVIELIKGDQINEAFERVVKSDVKFRFVIDIKNSHPASI